MCQNQKVNIVVGVTGGIAAYKTVSLVRELVRHGHDVHVVPTPDALKFIGQPTWEALSRNPVTTSVHEDVAQVRHVALAQKAQLVIVAPATANFIAKYAAGIADNLLGVTLIATTAPVLIAPAMHSEMWQHPATQANIEVLKERGVYFTGPESGPLTGGDSGPGRMSEPEEIYQAAMAIVPDAPTSLAPQNPNPARRIVISAGGTQEAIDPVRFIGNRSSGKQGLALALAAQARGFDVVLVLAHVDGSVLAAAAASGITIKRALTAAAMLEVMSAEAKTAEIVVMSAAVADYRMPQAAELKLSKTDRGGEGLILELEETTDVLASLVAARKPGQTLVGFAAETVSSTAELLKKGRAKRARKGADFLVLNQVSETLGFESDKNSVIVIDQTGAVVSEIRGSKAITAEAILDSIQKP